MFPRNENRNEGTSAKTTLLRTALLSPLDLGVRTKRVIRQHKGSKKGSEKCCVGSAKVLRRDLVADCGLWKEEEEH